MQVRTSFGGILFLFLVKKWAKNGTTWQVLFGTYFSYLARQHSKFILIWLDWLCCFTSNSEDKKQKSLYDARFMFIWAIGSISINSFLSLFHFVWIRAGYQQHMWSLDIVIFSRVFTVGAFLVKEGKYSVPILFVSTNVENENKRNTSPICRYRKIILIPKSTPYCFTTKQF